jgi:hypothetical protein
MSVVYMQHSEHGKMTCPEYEVPNHEKNGWRRIEQTISKPDVVVQEKTLDERYEKKFGKRPHHRMKKESIEAALME